MHALGHPGIRRSIALLVLLTAPAFGRGQAQAEKTQSLTVGELTILAPADWETTPDEKSLLTLLTPIEGPNDTFRENLRISSQEVTAGVGIDALFGQAQQAIAKADHPMKLVSKGTLTGNGHKILWMVLRPKQPKRDQEALTLIEYGFVAGGKAWSFKAMAADSKIEKFRASVERLLKTVEPKAGK